MPEIDCEKCTRLAANRENPAWRELFAQLDLGHDTLAHRIYWRLVPRKITATALAAMTDADILELPSLGRTALARIRSRVAAPASGWRVLEPDGEPCWDCGKRKIDVAACGNELLCAECRAARERRRIADVHAWFARPRTLAEQLEFLATDLVEHPGRHPVAEVADLLRLLAAQARDLQDRCDSGCFCGGEAP